jgi:hypothetical protein
MDTIRRNDTMSNDNDTQHNSKNCDTQKTNAFVLSLCTVLFILGVVMLGLVSG